MTSPDSARSHPAFTLDDTHSWVEQANGGSYRISIALPAAPTPARGLPVLYLLDAGATFATVVETHRRLARRPDATGVGPACIVGIGHESRSLYDPDLRQKDFLATGAESFLDYLSGLHRRLEGELLPASSRRVLAGHSLAGLFSLWALVHRPQAFSGYVSLSPSLWSNPELQAQAAGLAHGAGNDPAGNRPRVFIGVGGWEEVLPPWMAGQAGSEEIQARRAQRRMASNAESFARTLQKLDGGPETVFELFPDEDHASVFAVGISRAMRHVLAPTLQTRE